MSDQNQYQNQTSPGSGSFTERIEVAADELVSTIKDLLKEGNVRRVTVRNKDGKKLFSVPMTAGVAVGGVAVLAAPTLAALAAIAARAARVGAASTATPPTATPAVMGTENSFLPSLFLTVTRRTLPSLRRSLIVDTNSSAATSMRSVKEPDPGDV